MKYLIVLFSIVLAAPAIAADYVELKVSNESPRKAYVALSYYKNGNEIIEGWWTIDPFDEKTFSTVDLEADYRSPLKVRIVSASRGGVSWTDYEKEKRPCHPNHAFEYERADKGVTVKHKKNNGHWCTARIRVEGNNILRLPSNCGYEWAEFQVLYPGPKGRIGGFTILNGEDGGMKAIQSYHFNIPKNL